MDGLEPRGSALFALGHQPGGQDSTTPLRTPLPHPHLYAPATSPPPPIATPAGHGRAPITCLRHLAAAGLVVWWDWPVEDGGRPLPLQADAAGGASARKENWRGDISWEAWELK